MVLSPRKCPSVEGKVCYGSYPLRRMIPIACVLPVVANPAGVTIAVRNAMIGMTITVIVWLITCGYRRSLSAAIVCGDYASVVTTVTSAAVCVASFGRCFCGVCCSVCPVRGRVSCGTESQAASSGFAAGNGENVLCFWGVTGFRPVFFADCGPVVCSPAAASDSSNCFPGSHPACGSNCGVSLFCSHVFGPLGFVFLLGQFFVPVARAVVVLLLAWVSAGSCRSPSVPARLTRVPGPVPSPVGRLVPGPRLPLPVRGRHSCRPSGCGRVPAALSLSGSRGLALHRSQGLGRLPKCRLPPFLFYLLLWSLIRR